MLFRSKEKQVLSNQSIPIYSQVEEIDLSIAKDDNDKVIATDRALEPEDSSFRSNSKLTQSQEKSCLEKACPLFTIEYSLADHRFYQPYFNVTTQEVLGKAIAALIPYNGKFFEKIQSKPDLYGPFWIYITISFLITLVSNTMRYLNNPEQYIKFDFSMLPSSFIFVFYSSS